MDKQILEQYIDACELIKDTEEEIRKLRKRRRQIQQDSVKGPSHGISRIRFRPITWRVWGMRQSKTRMSWNEGRSCWRSGSVGRSRLRDR